MTHDLAIIGAGPGGYEAALEGAAVGLSVALVERSELGGVCLNAGCIPTKLLLGATDVLDELAAQNRARLAKGEIAVDFAAAQARKDRLILASRKAMAERLGHLGVEVLQGFGRLAGPNALQVVAGPDATQIGFRHLVISTGSRPRALPGLEPDGAAVLDSTGFLALAAVPQTLIVVGAGFIGLECAQIAARLGAKVLLFEAAPSIAPAEPAEVSKALESFFRRKGLEIRTNVAIRSLATREAQAVLTLESGEEFVADKALVAVGRTPNTADLGLETAGIVTENGWIKTDECLRAAENIYAVGDVNGRTLLAHAASCQGRFAVRHATGLSPFPFDPGPIPSILYGSPEAVRVGRMPSELKAVGLSARVSRADLAANPISQAHAAPQGFVMAVWSEDKVVGVAAVGVGVSRLAMPAALILREGWSREQAEGAVFPHPTLEESLQQALLAEPVDA